MYCVSDISIASEISYSISNAYILKMGGGLGQNITHAWVADESEKMKQAVQLM